MSAPAPIKPTFGHLAALRPLLLAALLAVLLALPAAATAAPPDLTINEPTAVETTKAGVSGEVDALGLFTEWWFETSTDAGANWIRSNVSGFSTGPGFEAVGGTLEGLTADQAHQVRLAAMPYEGDNAFQTEASAAKTFTTDPAPVAPTVVEVSATPAFSVAHLAGRIDPEGGNEEAGGSNVPIHWSFQLSDTGDPDSFYEVGSGDLTGSDAGADWPADDCCEVAAEPAGLTPGATYHYRLVVTYAGQPVEPVPGGEFTTQSPVTAPAVVIDPASQVTATTAHLSGVLTPGNEDPAFDASCTFDYVTDVQFDAAENGGWAQAQQIDCQPTPPIQGADPVSVSADPTGLLPGTEYHLRLRAANQGGETIDVAETFTTLAAAPVVAHTFVTSVGETTATLNAQVNPGGAPVTYHFDYVSQAQFDLDGFASAASTPESAPIGEDNSEHLASAEIADLDPGTTYRYRVVATNSVQATTGPDRAFHTEALPLSEPDACPNVARRAETGSEMLPDCRAWEMVSPPNKNGGSIGSVLGRTKAASDGSAVTFISMTSFGDASGAGVESEYMARRTAESGTPGWSTHGLTPKVDPLSLSSITAAWSPTYLDPISPDLDTGIIRTSTPLTDDSAVVGLPNLYLRRGLRTPGKGTYALLSECPNCGGTPLSPQLTHRELFESTPALADASSDFEQVLFESHLDLTGDGGGPVYGPVKLYLSDHGAVRLIGKVPPGGGDECGGGAPAPECVVPEQEGGASIAGLGAEASNLVPNVISDNGDLVNFSAPVTEGVVGEGTNLYQADSHGTASTADDTVLRLNRSERTVPEEHKVAIYQTASTDGNRVFFKTEEALTDDTPPGGVHLYMWQRQALPGGGHLTLIDRDEELDDGHGRVIGLIGASDDGSYAYFVVVDQLVAGAPPLADNQAGIYLWHEGAITYIGAFTAGERRADWDENLLDGGNIGSAFAILMRSRVSPDGRSLLFMATNGTGLTGYDHGPCGPGNPDAPTHNNHFHSGCEGYYLYRASTGELSCATCNPSGEPPNSDIIAFGLAREAANSVTGGYLNRALSDDGRRVFFTSKEQLVPRDTNGFYDAYQYDAESGQVRLLSSGTSNDDSYFLGAGADGRDVFFTTRERLSAWDVDGAYDLYDARGGGGFPEPAPTPPLCDESTCQGPAAALPPDPNLGSPQVRGPGTPGPIRKKCGKKKRRVYRNGKVRCVRKHPGKRANENRRAGK